MSEQEDKPLTKTQTQQKPRKKGGAPKWANEQQPQQHIVSRDAPPQEEDRRDKALKSRIKDRDQGEAKDSSLKIKIELDLEAEVNLYARVKGDITIGLL